jgi:hypothetical protein
MIGGRAGLGAEPAGGAPVRGPPAFGPPHPPARLGYDCDLMTPMR